MEFRRVLALRGPNVWASFPVLEAWVELGELKEVASSEIAGFNERLMSWLPTLVEHRCSVGTRGGFFERLRRGTYLAHVLEHVALELQTLAGTEVGFGRTRQANEGGVYKVVVRYREEEVGRACLEAARALCLAAVSGRPFDVGGEVEQLRALARRVCLPPGAAALVEAARQQDIPVRRLGPGPEGLVQLGHGARQRRLLAGLTDSTGALAEAVAQDHELTRVLLRAAGVPVPQGRPVADAADAWEAAQEVGLPVAVRPRHGSHRRGIRWGLSARADILAAYEHARQEGSAVLVERSVAGAEWRLLVVGERVVTAVRRHPAPGANAAAPDATEPVHPEVAARAVDAARAVGLEVAGVDLVAADVARPLEDQGGAVVRVHPRPNLALNPCPPELSGGRQGDRPAGGSRPAAEAVVAHLFPEGQTGRIPLVGVTGVNGKTTTTRLTAHLLGSAGYCVGMTCTEGIYVAGRRITAGDCSGPASAGWVLQNPRVEAAVLETARGGIVRAGLGFDRCDVAVVTNIGQGDHLGVSDIDTLEQLSYVKSTLVAAVAPGGAAVLWADDPHVVSMAPYCRGSVIYFSRDGRHQVVARHRAAGGRAVFDRGGHLVLAEGERETVLTSLRRVPLTHGGRIGFQVLNALAAAAAAWGLGLPPQTICAGLESFAARMGMVPGRFNVLEGNGATVVLDYGHNTSALEALTEALAQLPHRHRSIVYSGSGDRRDIDLRRQGQILGDAFDRVILYEDPRYLRGLPEGHMTAVFRQGLGAGKRVKEVQEVRSWRKAVEQALAALRPGELLVIQPDIIDETVELIRQYLNGRPPGEAETGRALLRLVEVDLAPAPADVEVRQGRLGKAVHALKAFEKGQTVLCGWGRPTPSRVRESIQVDGDLHIVPPPPLLYLNHSCEPSCGILIQRQAERLEVRALRRIEPGEELTVDYATFEQEIAGYNGRCLCGAPSCRGRITGYKDLPEALREAYGPYIAPHLRAVEAAGRGGEQEPAECDEEAPVGGVLSSPIPLR
jgi:cyanophycin synthetase